MQLAVFFVLLLLTFALGRIRQKRSWKFYRLIPGMLFFRVSITAAILTKILGSFTLPGDVFTWISIVQKTALYVAFVQMLLDTIWSLIVRLSSDNAPPPKILKDLASVGGIATVVASELNNLGMLSTVGSAAVLGGLAFIIGPGSSTVIANISSALAVQVERQFKVGDWVEIDGEIARVDNISWNSTYLFDTFEDKFIIIPNSMFDTTKVINHSRPMPTEFDVDMEVGLPLEYPPGQAMSMIRGVIDRHPGILDHEDTDVFIRSITETSIRYMLKFFIGDFANRNEVRTDLFSGIWYALDRAGYQMPKSFNLTTPNSRKSLYNIAAKELKEKNLETMLNLDLFGSLSEKEVSGIADSCPVLRYGPGEVIVQMGDKGESMFVIIKGTCAVLIHDPSKPKPQTLDEESFKAVVLGQAERPARNMNDMMEVAQLHSGTVFGEISALTHAPRTASIKAVTHMVLQEIGPIQIENVLRTNPKAMDAFAKVMSKREAKNKSLSEAETQSFENSFLDKMSKTFSRLFGG